MSNAITAAEMQAMDIYPSGNIKVAENLFDAFMQQSQVKETTYKGYTAYLKRFCRWLHDQGIQYPQKQDILNYISALDAAGLSAGTRGQYIRAVKAFFKWTASEGIYPNISANIKNTAKVKRDGFRKDIFNDADIKSILDSIDTTSEKGSRDYAMILLSVTCGLRIIELQRGNVADVDTFNNVRRLWVQGKGHDDKDQCVYLSQEATRAIDQYLKIRNAGRHDPLFVSVSNRAKGCRLTEPRISSIIKNRFKAAGFDSPRLTSHSLRHSAITIYMQEADSNIFKAQRYARHKDPKVTEYYAHVNNDDMQELTQKVSDRIFGNKTNYVYESDMLRIFRELSNEDKKKLMQYAADLAGKGHNGN